MFPLSVFERVMHGLLRDAIKMIGNAFVTNQYRILTFEAARDRKKIFDLACKLLERRHQTMRIGQLARFANGFVHQPHNFAGLRGFGQRLFRKPRLLRLTHKGDARQVLPQPVVQILSDAVLFEVVTKLSLGVEWRVHALVDGTHRT